jgi:chromosome segregation ATPase
MLKKLSTQITELSAKKRRIEEDINILQITYDTKKKDVDALSTSTTDLRESLLELSSTIENVNLLGEKSVAFGTTAVSEALNVLRDITDVVEKAVKMVDEANTKITERKTEITVLEKNLDKKNENIENEQRRLNTLKSDLGIYKSRLQKKYDEMELGELIL